MEDEFADLRHLSLFQAGSGQASRLKHRNSVKQLREKDVDLVYDEEDTIDYRPQERDFKHKQVPNPSACSMQTTVALTPPRSSRDGR